MHGKVCDDASYTESYQWMKAAAKELFYFVQSHYQLNFEVLTTLWPNWKNVYATLPDFDPKLLDFDKKEMPEHMRLAVNAQSRNRIRLTKVTK